MSVQQLRNVSEEPDVDVINALQEALEEARTGSLRSVAIIGDMKGNKTFTAFSTDDTQRTAGQLAFLLHTVCARQRENMK